MDKETILMAMNHIDESLVAEAAVQQSRRRASWKRAALIAACLCLVCTVSVGALIGSGVPMRFLNDHKYVGLKKVMTDDVTVALYGAESTVRISVDELSEDIKKLAMEQEEETEWHLFSSWIGMEMCLDMDIAYNPVLIVCDRARQGIPGSSIEEEENFDYGLMRVSKDLSNIRMHEIYLNGDYTISLAASITTDAARNPQTDDDIVFNGMFRAYTEKEIENLLVEEYTMANGCTASIVTNFGLGYNPIRSYSAFFQTDKALIAVYVNYPASTVREDQPTQDEIDERNEAMLAQLKLVLDGFQ